MFIKKTETITAVDNDYDAIQNRDRHRQINKTTKNKQKTNKIFNETLKNNNNKTTINRINSDVPYFFKESFFDDMMQREVASLSIHYREEKREKRLFDFPKIRNNEFFTFSQKR